MRVTDAVGNDTEYHYHASFSPFFSDPDLQIGALPDDGLAPEWNDGLNHKIEYYRGTGVGRALIRTEIREYDTDKRDYFGQLQKNKENSRVRRTATLFHDDGGVEGVVANSGWDGRGNWRTVTESGFGVPGQRTTQTDYFVPSGAYITGLFNYVETHDGQRVLRRTDNHYGNDGRLETSIDRRRLPGRPTTPKSTTALKGDVRTTYTYDANRVLISKSIGSGGDGAGIYPDVCMDYTWNLQAYLKTKTFRTSCGPGGTSMGWKAIDRKRDGNTGLIYSARDTAEFETRYSYDLLGRISDITPNAPEHPSAIDYVSLRETTLTRNPASATDFGFSRYRYDGLGRLTCEEKRPADAAGGYPFQTTRYDAMSRIVFKSEWLPPGGTTCDPAATVGTISDYGTPPDPFGRVAQATTADGKVTTMTYQGHDSTVTVQEVVGAGGTTVPVTTKYFRDAFERLIMVDAPADGGADAIYTYDLLGNITQVDLYDPSNPTKKQSRYFEYDGLGRLYQATHPENGTTVFEEYDGLGNAKRVTNASGVTMKSLFDGAGRLTQALRTGSPDVVLAENFYDVGTNALGKLSSTVARDDNGAILVSKALAYTGLNGRPSSLTHTFPGVSGSLAVSFGYDNYGNVSSQTYPEGPAGKGGALTVSYDHANGIPVAVREGATTLGAVTYDPAGGVQTLTTPGNVRTRVLADNRNRPADITIGTWSGGAFQSTYYASGPYAYDGAGNIFQIGPDTGARNSRYRYDGANRLIEVYEQHPDAATTHTQCFKYDAFGNINEKVDRITTTPCSGIVADPDLILTTLDQSTGRTSNRILNEQRKGSSAVINYIYDAAGNVTKDYVRRPLYDSRNRLAALYTVQSAADPASAATEVARYEYDSDGHRTMKREAAMELNTFFVRGPDGKLASEFRRTRIGGYQPEWLKHHVYLAGREVALRENRLPAPPSGLTVRRGTQNTRIDLAWNKSPQDEGITSYKIYRSVGTGAWSLLTTINSGTICLPDPAVMCYTNSSLTNGIKYSYQITAVSAQGESYGSDVNWMNAGDTTAPAAPTCLSGTVGDRMVTLTWNASTSNDVMGYQVYRGTSSTNITPTLVQTTKYVDSGLANDANYAYWVKAVDNAGNISAVNVNTGCAQSGNYSGTPRDFAPPAPPRNVRAAADCAGASTITVTWDPSLDSDVTSYLIDRDPPFVPPGPKAPSHSMSHIDTGLALGTYHYWLVAPDTPGNTSAPSQIRAAKLRVPASQIPPPPGALTVTAGNGQVLVRFNKPTPITGITAFTLYRKLNAEPSCDAYQQVSQLQSAQFPPGSSFIDLEDNGVPNAVAWDYAIVSQAGEEESAFSRTGLAIPVAPPSHYRECVDVPPPSSDGVMTCGGDLGNRRTVMKWTAPAGKSYHPISATNADGTLGYLVGYHARRYEDMVFGAPNLGKRDASVAVDTPYLYDPSSDVPQDMNWRCSLSAKQGQYCNWELSTDCDAREACIPMGSCVMDSAITCSTNADCVTGTTCYNTCQQSPATLCVVDGDCPSGPCSSAAKRCGMSTSGHDAPPCAHKGDCPATASCRFSGPDIRATRALASDPYLLDGQVEYFQELPGPFTKCGMIAAVYKVYADGSWRTVVSDWTNFDPTKTGADSSEIGSRCTPYPAQCDASSPQCADSEPPPITAAPTFALTGPGKVMVSWQPPADITNVAGYYLYVREEMQTALLTPVPPRPYSASAPLPFVTVPVDNPACAAGTACYELTGFPSKARNEANGHLRFQVAAFDANGQVGTASPLSSQATPPAAAEPMSLKTVIWTVNDASVDGTAGFGARNPRSLDGIKLQWKGSGNRVYRSETADGTYCALLQAGPGNPAGVPICADTTAFSDSQTTAAPTSTTNARFFHDLNVVAGKVYYYKVTHISGGTESGSSNVVAGMALERPAQPLSSPRHLKAWAPWEKQTDDTWKAGAGVYLRWCPNPTEEGVTGYRVYRSTVTRGPYTLHAEIDNPMSASTIGDNCLMGSRRCSISSACTGGPPCPAVTKTGTCTIGPGGSCKIIDLANISYPWIEPENYPYPNDQTQKYYYVVTALRGSEESGYSNENVALPNYFCSTCNPPAYWDRYDPDNAGDVACDDWNASFDEGASEPRVAAIGEEHGAEIGDAPDALDDDMSAPYRVIGAKVGSNGGGGGTAVPSASPRWLFYHADHLGSPRVITSISGTVVSSHHFMPFGEERPIAAKVSTNAIMFTGHERDRESAASGNPDGMDYMLARYYSSSLGRFMAVDPAADSADPENPQTWNRYAYANNNPILMVDENGESATVAGAIVGGLVSGGMALVQGKSWKEVGAAAAGGAVAGAMIGSVVDTGGASLGVMLAAGAMAGAAGGMTENAITGQPNTAGGVAMDAAAGAGGVALGASVGAALEGAATRSGAAAAAEGAKVDGPSNRSPLGKGLDPSKYNATSTSEPATGRAHRGGTSTRTQYTPQGGSAPTLEQHTIVKDGTVTHQHFKKPE